jgi:hypothetical protein
MLRWTVIPHKKVVSDNSLDNYLLTRGVRKFVAIVSLFFRTQKDFRSSEISVEEQPLERKKWRGGVMYWNTNVPSAAAHIGPLWPTDLRKTK